MDFFEIIKSVKNGFYLDFIIRVTYYVSGFYNKFLFGNKLLILYFCTQKTLTIFYSKRNNKNTVIKRSSKDNFNLTGLDLKRELLTIKIL